MHILFHRLTPPKSTAAKATRQYGQEQTNYFPFHLYGRSHNSYRKFRHFENRYFQVLHTEDKKYVYGITGNLNTNTEYVIHMIKDTDTLDSLALKYYGRPDLFWVIADFNRIHDPYIKLDEQYNFLNIPSLAGIRYM